MEILNAKVRWGDIDRIQLLVDRIPKREELIFESTSDNAFWYGEKDGFVMFYSGHPDKEGRGFCGRSFELKTKNQGTVTLVGPYDSSASTANSLGFGPCVDVAMTDNRNTYSNDGVFIARSITVEKAEEAIRNYATSAIGLKKSGDWYKPYK